MSRELIEKFYCSFQNKDWKTMQSCYHTDARFTDPVFQNLSVKEVKAMWHMLCLAGKDLTVTFNRIESSEQEGSCHWEATYSFSRTERKVHNIIAASFEFRDGKIVRHEDVFDLWRWSGMALGMTGKLLGWSPMVQNKIRATARKSLTEFIAEHPEYQ
jgi:ketosteroid isomerase-like protein